ncbi:hypothetical protein SLA2020_143340 [Shorea laevis]
MERGVFEGLLANDATIRAASCSWLGRPLLIQSLFFLPHLGCLGWLMWNAEFEGRPFSCDSCLRMMLVPEPPWVVGLGNLCSFNPLLFLPHAGRLRWLKWNVESEGCPHATSPHPPSPNPHTLFPSTPPPTPFF